MKNGYQYENRPRNVFRFALAVWRVLKDPENTREAGIVELTFNRSRWGSKIARWDQVAAELIQQHPQLKTVIDARRRLPRVDLDELQALPAGTLGHTLAVVERKRDYDPNLIDPLPHDSEGDWLMAHLYETHDFWHVLTGFDFDLEGELGVGGVYMAQLPNATFFGFMLSLIMLKVVWKHPEQHGAILAAFNEGYRIGQRCQPLLGLDWQQLCKRDLNELRSELNIDDAGRIEAFARAA
jgi:ubiquinone biosynthesis protein Coq4